MALLFKIWRFKPGVIDPPRFETFQLPAAGQMTVLDCLEMIRLTQDRGLMYRHSCHHSACGTCAVRMNGVERLACVTRVAELDSEIITLEPLNGFPPIADLVVDMTAFYADIDSHWSCLKPSNTPAEAALNPGEKPLRLEDCIECGCCVSVCPVVADGDAFMGPAALAALSNQLSKTPQERVELLARAGVPRGEPRCRRALDCSRICPTKVYPARHIAELRRLREKG